jgi:phosphoribosyl 1,2-cyclic phosphate phosphodiesterase
VGVRLLSPAQMEILFLGTSAGWPLPRLGCNCEICSSNDSKDKRLRPSLLVNQQILIDASPDLYHQFQKYKIRPSSISHIFITHGHDDHFMGLYDLSHIYNHKEKITLIATKGVLSKMQRIVGISMRAFHISEAKPFEKIDLGKGNYVWFIPVEHGSTECYAIKIKAPKPIFYAPEFRKILPSSRKQLGNCDLAIIDGSSKTSYGQAKGHETIDEGLRLGQDIHAKRVLFTNIGHKTDIHNNLVNFVKEKGEKFGIAFDGLEVKL